MLNKMNLWTSIGPLVGIKIVNQQNFIRDKPNITNLNHCFV